MSKDLDRIKKALKYSSTMPSGTASGTTGAWLMGSGHVHGPDCNHGHNEESDHEHHHDHNHKDDGSCCGDH